VVTKKVTTLVRVRSVTFTAALTLAVGLFGFMPTAAADPGYARGAAQQWALANVSGSHKYPEDCTWYVSRALWAGGMDKTPDWTDSSFDLGRVASVKQPGGPTKTAAAPVTVIVAYDLDFAQEMPFLFPHNPDAKYWFSDPAVAQETAMRNGSLQGAYFMLAARALGLDSGPMSGFDKDGVDQAFFAGTSWRSNFLCNLGFGTTENLLPRLPRLAFERACRTA